MKPLLRERDSFLVDARLLRQFLGIANTFRALLLLLINITVVYVDNSRKPKSIIKDQEERPYHPLSRGSHLLTGAAIGEYIAVILHALYGLRGSGSTVARALRR